MAHVVAVGVDDAAAAAELWRGPALSLHGVGREVAGAPPPATARGPSSVDSDDDLYAAGTKLAKPARRASKSRVLQNVSGVFPPGRMCALMGPSGAGKSTLLEAASGRSASTAGALGKVSAPPRHFARGPRTDAASRSFSAASRRGPAGSAAAWRTWLSTRLWRRSSPRSRRSPSPR